MMVKWQFKEDDVKEFDGFELIPVGDYRARMEEITEKLSSTKKDMLEMKIKVSGYPGTVLYYLVFDESNTQMTNTKLAQIFESFQISKGDMNFQNWKGKVGGVRIKHEPYNGNQVAKIHYFLNQKRMQNLPAWQDTAGVASVSPTTPNPPFTISEDDIQF